MEVEPGAREGFEDVLLLALKIEKGAPSNGMNAAYRTGKGLASSEKNTVLLDTFILA